MFREAGVIRFLLLQCHALPRTTAPPCLPLGIKDSLKEDVRLSTLGLLLWGLLLWGFLLWELWVWRLLAFWMKRGFLIWEALEGKRIAEGTRLLKRKELLEENSKGELLASLRLRF
jgi:hypothetical protein